jgi:hypothetical protein
VADATAGSVPVAETRLEIGAPAALESAPRVAVEPETPPSEPRAVSTPAVATTLQPAPAVPGALVAAVPTPEPTDLASGPPPPPKSSPTPSASDPRRPVEAVSMRPLPAAEVVPSRELPTPEPASMPAVAAAARIDDRPPRRAVQSSEASVARRLSDAPVAPASSALGLGPGRLRIRLDGAATRVTDRDTEVISGTLVGGSPEQMLVQVDNRTSVPSVAGRTFTTAVTLSPGVNRVRVVAIDASGAEAEETLTIEYAQGSDVTIRSPVDGHTLVSGDLPFLTVDGEVTDPSVDTVWIVANDRRVATPVVAGRFRQVVPLLDATVQVRAEAGEGRRSRTVSVHAAAALPAISMLLAEWPAEVAGPAQMMVTWRPNAARLDAGVQQLPMQGLTADTVTASADIFYLRNARPGVYTFWVAYRAGVTPAVRPVLYLAGAPRSLRPVTLDGSGRTVIARLLLPQGVLWEQDDWFSGRSASGETVTKFRFPDGVSWTERLRDLGR